VVAVWLGDVQDQYPQLKFGKHFNVIPQWDFWVRKYKEWFKLVFDPCLEPATDLLPMVQTKPNFTKSEPKSTPN